MVGKKPEKGKVVSLPQDRTYQQGFRAGKHGSEQLQEEESGYLSSEAEDALKKLRVMGG